MDVQDVVDGSAVVDMFQPGANTSAELFFEEREMFDAMEEEAVEEDDSDDDDEAGMDVDDLLDEDIDDDFEDKGIIKNLKKNLNASDEDAGIDDD